jgi:hypothetical protein
MIKEISYNELPDDLKPHFDGWRSHFDKSILSGDFIGINHIGPDPNLNCHNSREKYLEWMGTLPPKGGIPHKDERFYPREFSAFSSFCKAKKVVEFGTNLGAGTFLLSKLNPDAEIFTTDIVDSWSSDGCIFEIGHIAKVNKVKCHYLKQNSHDLSIQNVDFCFIDGDHREQGVYKDSLRAWENRNKSGWLIAWHDFVFDEEMTGNRKSIEKFSNEVGITVYKLDDSGTAWAYGCF